MGKVQKKVKKKTNNSAFSATHTYIKLTLAPFPKSTMKGGSEDVDTPF